MLEKTVNISLLAEACGLNFQGLGEVGCLHYVTAGCPVSLEWR